MRSTLHVQLCFLTQLNENINKTVGDFKGTKCREIELPITVRDNLHPIGLFNVKRAFTVNTP